MAVRTPARLTGRLCAEGRIAYKPSRKETDKRQARNLQQQRLEKMYKNNQNRQSRYLRVMNVKRPFPSGSTRRRATPSSTIACALSATVISASDLVFAVELGSLIWTTLRRRTLRRFAVFVWTKTTRIQDVGKPGTLPGLFGPKRNFEYCGDRQECRNEQSRQSNNHCQYRRNSRQSCNRSPPWAEVGPRQLNTAKPTTSTTAVMMCALMRLCR